MNKSGKYSKTEREKVIGELLISYLVKSYKDIPGDIVKNLPQSMRDILVECTSEDYTFRLEDIKLFIPEPEGSKEKKAFDIKIGRSRWR